MRAKARWALRLWDEKDSRHENEQSVFNGREEDDGMRIMTS